MGKKVMPRKIVVDDVQYQWRADSWGLTIWKDKNNKLLDSEDCCNAIKPGLVASIIKETVGKEPQYAPKDCPLCEQFAYEAVINGVNCSNNYCGLSDCELTRKEWDKLTGKGEK